MKELLKLRSKAKDDFYQAKNEHYKKFNLLALTASGFAFIILFVVDFDLMVAYYCQVVMMLNIVSFIVTKLYFDHYSDNEKLQFLLLHDPLTQVFNRNKLDETIGISRDLSFISKYISVLVLDVDYFKKVNDIHGHDQGDVILKFVASQIKNSLRKEDIVIRWGGEEFVAILPECRLNQAFDIAERMRKEIEESDNGVCKLTVSIGIAEYLGGDCIDTINKADKALYEAKSEGRNKVKRYEDVMITV